MRFVRLSSFTVVALAAVLSACATTAAPSVQLPADLATVNPDFQVDNTLAEAGRSLFLRRSCSGCHGNIGSGGGKAAPALFGVTERRTIDWLKQFLMNTEQMLASDPIAMALLEEFRGMRMPQITIAEPEVEAIIHYLAAESQRVRMTRGE